MTTNCTSCESGYYYNSTSNTCAASCIDGNYGNSTDNTCYACSLSDCDKCSSDTICTECDTSKTLLTDGTCGDTCETDEFEDNYGLTIMFCRSCPSTCETCTNMTQCDTCKTNFYAWTISAGDIKCVETCPDGTFGEDTGTLVCTDCMTNCNQCTSDTLCDECVLGMVSQTDGTDDTCQASCDTGYYDLGGVCTACDSDCDVCTGNNQCTTCASGYSRNDTICIADATCIGDYFVDSGVCTE